MDALELKEREFAQKLKQCTGSEELEVILNYINWLEKNCPQKGLDGEVIDILSNTLTKFNEVQYSNDTRYIGLLVKYMQAQPNALELYQLAVNQGKGVECAVLYCAWAGHLARMKDLNAANQVYQMAIEKNAQPVHQLQLAYLLFQINVGRTYLGLTELDAFNSDVIDAFLTLGPERMPPHPVNSQHNSVTAHSSQMKTEEPAWPVAVFDPDNPKVVCCYPKKEIYQIENHEYQYEEILAMRREGKSQRPAVKDQQKVAIVENNEEEPKSTVAIFEPENPKVVKCYPFKEVYGIENHEFQLEEVYATRYEKKRLEAIENKEKNKEKRKSRLTLHPTELADLTNSFLQQGSAEPKSSSEQVANSSHMNQSVTREVMNMVQDMWKSPSPLAVKNQAPPMASIRKGVFHTATATKTPFKVHTDQMEVDGTPANKENPHPAQPESTLRSNLHSAAKTPFKIYTDPHMEVDGTPVSKENNSSANQKKAPADNNPQSAKPAFTSRFQRNQFVANDWTNNQPADENPQSLASAVRPSSENTSASNMNQSVTREVMNIIQDMWKDSTPSPVKGKQMHPQSVLVGKGIPIFTDEKPDPKMATAAATTAKRLTQPATVAAAVSRFSNHHQQQVQSRKALQFGAALPELKENQVPVPAHHFRHPTAPRGLTKPPPPHDDVEMLTENDFGDTTCNTRAFQLALPSSTPLIHPLRGNNAYNKDANNCSMLLADGSHKPNTDLSIIMEASKEKYSSSSGSSSGVRTPYTINKHHPTQNEDIKEETEDSQLDRLVSQISIDDNFDPFCPKFVGNLLSSINFPQNHHAANMVSIDKDAPALSHNATVTLGRREYRVESDLGEGSYARVVRASTNSPNKKTVGLKLQKPGCAWEYYIAKEIQTRLKKSHIVQGFINIDCAFIYKNASILEMEFAPYGNLLSAINKVKLASGKQIHVSIATLISIQLFDIVDHLHKCRIIHGDIKPDNFVIFSLPSTDPLNICVKLIDFGRSIDMSLLPEGIEFRRVVKTEDFQCNEMKDGRPWTYQTDLFGLAGTTYLLLMGEYMKVVKKGNEWVLKKNLYRYLHREVWLPIYEELLNVESCSKLPNLSELRGRLQALLVSVDQKWLSQCLMSFGNVLQGR